MTAVSWRSTREMRGSCTMLSAWPNVARKCDESQGFRPEFMLNYYGAYFRDPEWQQVLRRCPSVGVDELVR